jgi:hypothetical protein
MQLGLARPAISAADWSISSADSPEFRSAAFDLSLPLGPTIHLARNTMKRSLVAACCFTLLCLYSTGCNSKTDPEPKQTLLGKIDASPVKEKSSEKADEGKAPGPNGQAGGFDFSRIDPDGDGKVSRDEAPNRLAESFDAIDTDKDGFLVESEILQFVRQMPGRRGGGPSSGGGGPSSGGGRPTSSSNESAVVAMLERVGGSLERAGVEHGPDPIACVALVDTTATAEDVALLKNLADLYELELASKGLGDDCLVHLKDFPTLVFLRLSGDQFTDEGMTQISSLRELRKIELKDTVIGSKGLVTLSKMPNLEILYFIKQEIGPERLEALREFRNLYEINFADCKVSEEELAKLRKALPDCDVIAE